MIAYQRILIVTMPYWQEHRVGSGRCCNSERLKTISLSNTPAEEISTCRVERGLSFATRKYSSLTSKLMTLKMVPWWSVGRTPSMEELAKFTTRTEMFTTEC